MRKAEAGRLLAACQGHHGEGRQVANQLQPTVWFSCCSNLDCAALLGARYTTGHLS